MQPTTPAPAGAAAPATPLPDSTSILASAAAEEAVDPAKAAESTATTDTKKASEKPAEKAAEAPAPIELKLPDGVELDAALVDGFKKTAAEVGLDSAKAQKVMETFVSAQQAVAAAEQKALQAQDAKWAAELKADPDIGGEKFNASMVDVRRALRHFGGGKVAALIHAAGLGNHPDMVRGFVKMGRALAEDSISGTSDKAGAQPQQTPFESFYDHPTSKQSK